MFVMCFKRQRLVTGQHIPGVIESPLGIHNLRAQVEGLKARGRARESKTRKADCEKKITSLSGFCQVIPLSRNAAQIRMWVNIWRIVKINFVNKDDWYEWGTNVTWAQVESDDHNMSLETSHACSPIGIALSSPSYLLCCRNIDGSIPKRASTDETHHRPSHAYIATTNIALGVCRSKAMSTWKVLRVRA